MPTWTIRVLDEGVTVSYRDHTGKVQDCGRSELSLRNDVEAWVFDQADRGDVILTDRGVFVRLAVPPGLRI